MPSKKFTKFVRKGEFVNMPVKTLPGIGEKLGNKLIKKGYPNAMSVLLMFSRYPASDFKSWLRKTCGANNKAQEEVYCAVIRGLKQWQPHKRYSI